MFNYGLSEDEIYTLYKKGYSLKYIISMVLSRTKDFTPIGAKRYVEGTIQKMLLFKM